jgi:hypothetical protein
MGAYLFVHFREKTTPDGEQVYFGLSRDGFKWEAVNAGKPVLISTLGECGVRDHVIFRKKEGGFIILATDLSLANNFATKYHSDWKEVNHNGSPYLSKWESEDLVHWSEQELIKLVDDSFGCVWAPEIIADEENCDYMVHWSSFNNENDPDYTAIYYAKTKDFKTFSKPEILCSKKDTGIIDSNIVYADGYYYRFIKSDFEPNHIMLHRSTSLIGDYERMPAFDEEIEKEELGQFEAPTCFKLSDGRWCVMLDYYGCDKDKQGYIPFVAEDISTGRFVRSDAEFSFPYGFKHGTVMSITDDEYERIKGAFGV